jgi:hypothetical protein
VEDLRRRAGALGAAEQAVADAGLRVGFGTVGKREQIDREEDVEVLQRVTRRLAEPVVERSSARSADLIATRSWRSAADPKRSPPRLNRTESFTFPLWVPERTAFSRGVMGFGPPNTGSDGWMGPDNRSRWLPAKEFGMRRSR